MAEVNKEKQHIHLIVCGDQIDIYVKSELEKLYRDADRLIKATYGKYAEMFRGNKDRGDHFIMSTALLEIAVMYQMEHAKKETDSYDDLLERLTSEIDKALK